MQIISSIGEPERHSRPLAFPSAILSLSTSHLSASPLLFSTHHIRFAQRNFFFSNDIQSRLNHLLAPNRVTACRSRPVTARALAAMSATATVLLDNQYSHFTNLDTLSGRVVLRLPMEAAIAGIQVKLEGESHTRLSGPRYPQNVNSEKKRTELEVHKVRG